MGLIIKERRNKDRFRGERKTIQKISFAISLIKLMYIESFLLSSSDGLHDYLKLSLSFQLSGLIN